MDYLLGLKWGKVCYEGVQEALTLACVVHLLSWMDETCDPPPRSRTSPVPLIAGLELETRLAPVSHVAVSPGFNTLSPQKPRAAACSERLVIHGFALRQQVGHPGSGFKYPVAWFRAALPAANSKHNADHFAACHVLQAAVSVVVPLHYMNYLIDFL